ncbi:MAG: HAD-IIIA family hydrolase [PVC group bacterium]|nr:HAD-IIIA family hydrolase [PVC group bacterium]
MMNQKAEKIKIVIVDVDGVLTNGTIIYGNFGDEYRSFSVHDGMGFALLHRTGIKSAIITAKSSRAVSKRAKELKINLVFKNVKNKLLVFKKLLKRLKLKPEEACYIGDDLLDLATIQAAGFSITVPQACKEVKEAAHYITQKNAGAGAVREAIELILKAQSKWPALIKTFES